MEDQVIKNKTESLEQIPAFENVTTIGIFLKSEREKKNLTLKQISQKTKINLTQLEYLEDDKLDLLPNRAYVVGYLKSYSKALGIEHHLPMACLEKTYSILNPVIKPVIQEKKTSESSNSKVYLLITAIVVVAILSFMLISNVTKNKMKAKSKSSEESQPSTIVSDNQTGQIVDPTVVPAANNETSLQVSSEVISQTASTHAQANTLLVTNKSIPIENSQGKTQNKTEIVPPATTDPSKTSKVEDKDKDKDKNENKDKFEFFPMQKKLYSVAQNPSEETLKYFPKDTKNSIAPGKQNLFIYAHKGDSWITYQIDEKDPRQRVLTHNTSINLVGNTLKVFFGNVNAATVFLNGKLINIDTKTGVRNLVFPEEKSSQYVFPLFIFNKQTGEIITSEEYLKENPIKKN